MKYINLFEAWNSKEDKSKKILFEDSKTEQEKPRIIKHI